MTDPFQQYAAHPVSPLDAQIQSAASMAGVPFDIAKRLVETESSGNPRAKSPVGAMGLTQLMPGTAKMLGVSDPYNPAENLAGGFKYLASLKNQFGDWSHALAAYNWGPGNVQSWIKAGANFNALPAETQAYVKRIAPHEAVAIAQPPFHRRSHLQLLGERTKSDPFASYSKGSGNSDPFAAYSGPQQPPPQKPNNLLPSEAQQLATSLYQKGLGDYRGAARTLTDAANEPTRIINAVLGAPQRLVAGALNADQQHGGIDKASIIDEAKGAWYGLTHPNDDSVQEGAKRALHWPQRNNNPIPHGLQSMLTPAGALEHGVSDPRVQNLVSDIGFQTITDPLTHGMGGVRAAGSRVIQRARDAGTAALRSGKPVLQNFAGTFIPHDDVQAAFTPRGKAAVVGIRNSQDLVAQQMQHDDAQLLKKYKTEIAQGNVPDEVRQRLLREPYVYGTPEMRQQALAQGYRPTKDEIAANGGKPYGILNHPVRADYFPHVGNHRAPDEYQAVGKTYNIKPNAKFEKQQTSEELPQDPFDSMEYRLMSGRNIIRHRMIQKRIAEETGVPVNDLGKTSIPANQELINEHVHNLPAASRILDGAQQSKQVKGADWLKHISNVGRDTLIGANPIPHMKNIGVLGYLSGGVPVVAKGIYYAAHGVPKKITDWMEHYGAATHFALTEPDTISYGARALGPIRQKNAQILDAFDTGIRAATYERVIKEFPHLSPYEQAEKINEDIGAYKDSPAYVEALRKWTGAQFPQWHGYIVPTAVGRAAIKNPQRVETMVRSQDNFNKDVIGKNAGYGIDFGGPVNEFATLTNAPGEKLSGEKPSYFTSPSIIGLGSALTGSTSQPQSFNPPGGDLLQQIIPYYSMIAPQLGINPFNSKAPPNVRTIAAFFAAYPKAQESAREAMVRDFMQQGMSRFKAEQQAQRIFSRMRRSMR